MDKMIGLALLGAVLLWVVVPMVATVVQVMRVRQHRMRMPAWADIEGEEVCLRPDQLACLDEVRELGFECLAQGHLQRGQHEVPFAFLRSDDGLTCCDISFSPNLHTAYFATFSSIDSDGALVVTSNRVGWMGPLQDFKDPTFRSFDAQASNLRDQLAYHRKMASGVGPVDPGVVYERACQVQGKMFDDWVRRKLIVQGRDGWHIAFNTAFEIAFRAIQSRTAGPTAYETRAWSDSCRGDWLATAWEQWERDKGERANRPDLKATVLVGSLVLSLGAWGSFLDLGSAFAITIVLLVHEAGHALAMRWLGWRDVSMFFIPLFGGLATGRASDPAAWKRVVVLLAGPLPGLVAGFLGLWLVMFHPAFVPADWKPFTLLLAAMAVVVNLANLLPLSPLDGGRLVEMAVFSRWPRARALFVALGVVIMAIAAVMLRDGFLGVLAVMLLAWLPGQWRIATLHAQVQATPAGSFQPQALGTLVATKFAKLPLLQQFGVLHGLVDAFRVPKPGHWERAVAIGVMVVVWSVGAGVAIKYDLLRHARTSLSDSRTAAQRAFDEARDAYDDEEAGPADQQLARLLDRAAGLPSEDPRRVDAQVAQALHQPPGARRDALGPIIAAGHDGQRWSVSGLISSELAQVEAKALELPPDEALARMEEGLSWATGLAPHRLEPTIHLRLRMMEALDRQGREDEVGAALGDLRAKVAAANDCRCSAHAVISAQAWHRIHHDDPQGALKVIDEGLPTVAASGHRALQRDRAWALLLDAQAQQGLTQMQEAVSVKTARGSISYGSWGMDLIYAMDAAGKEAQAHTLLKEMPEWTCDAAKSRDRGEIESVAPWQGRRQALLQDIGTRYCPAAGR